MADFCRQCAEFFGMSLNDMRGLITKEHVAEGYGVPQLCEGCGPTLVDDEGRCISHEQHPVSIEEMGELEGEA